MARARACGWLLLSLGGFSCGAAHEDAATTGRMTSPTGAEGLDGGTGDGAGEGRDAATYPADHRDAASDPDPADSLDPDKVARGPGVARGACDEREQRDCYPFAPESFGQGNCQVGRQVCPGGEFSTWQVCEGAVGPREETCNAQDDDCDGDIDEGLLNACGQCGEEPVEACNAVDDDCDGKVDEGCSCEAVATGSSADVLVTPADILLIVDNSASMNEETSAVQTQLQAFADRLAQGGLDARLILLSTRGTGAREICIAPPLAGASCADNPPQNFFHIDESISSSLGLHDLEKRYPDYQPLLRVGASFHVAIITDDDELWTADEFLARSATWTPAPPALTYHAVVATQDCPAAADIGEHHMEIASRTGGTIHNLCDQRIDLALNGIADSIVKANIACSWTLPSAPPGGALDVDASSVTQQTGSGLSTSLPRRTGEAACGATLGFYVQGSEVRLCATSCSGIQDDAQARVEVRIPCVLGGP